MKNNRPSAFGCAIERYFREYLPTLRGMSVHTIHSYRDAIILFLRFVSAQKTKAIENLDLDDFTAEQVQLFLAFLEEERHNGIGTRNARRAALHTLARFLATEQPAHLAELQRVLGLPFKRGARQAPIEYFEQNELEALFASIDRTTSLGPRDYALFALMFNTGGRVQEILDLRPCDVRTEPPYQVRLQGKGSKVRLCPIWKHTAKLLRDLAQQPASMQSNETPLFKNSHGVKLTRFGVRYLLKKYVEASIEKAPTLKGKRIYPHSMRHTTAISLLKAGIDFATISQWLGHASLNTTMNYARADIDIKREALAQVFPDFGPPPEAGKIAMSSMNIADWLKRL